MSKRTLLTVALCSSLWVCGTHAQERVITVDELFELCDSCKSTEIAFDALRQAAEGVKAAKGGLTPTLEASLSASFNGDGYVIDRDFGGAMKAEIPHFGNSFVLKAMQVIYAGGAIDAGIKRARIGEKIAEKGVEMTRQNVRFAMLGNYLELYKLSNVKAVYERNIEKSRLLLEQIRARHAEGVALASDVTRYELQLQRLGLAVSEINNALATINYRMTTTLGMPSSTIIVPDKSITEEPFREMGKSDWHAIGENSLGIQMADLDLRMQKERERAAKAERLPQIALVAENSFNGPITIEIPAINKNFNYWYVGVGVSYNFSSLWKANRKIRAERAGTIQAQHKAELAREETDIAINSAFIALQNSAEKVLTNEKSLELAKENYEIINSRYNDGLALITEMVDASDEVLDAEVQLVNSRIDVVYNRYNLQYISGTLDTRNK